MNELDKDIIECAVADGFTYKESDTLEVIRAQFNSGKDMGEWWIKVRGTGTGSRVVQTMRRVTDEDLKQWRRNKSIDTILPNS
jgi:hypothetical protein